MTAADPTLRLVAYLVREACGLPSEEPVTLPCGAESVREMALAARQQLDALRAEVEREAKERAEAERGPSITRADARELLEMSDLTTSEACYERVRAALRAYAGSDFECHQPNPLDAEREARKRAEIDRDAAIADADHKRKRFRDELKAATARAERAEAEWDEARADLARIARAADCINEQSMGPEYPGSVDEVIAAFEGLRDKAARAVQDSFAACARMREQKAELRDRAASAENERDALRAEVERLRKVEGAAESLLCEPTSLVRLDALRSVMGWEDDE